MGYEKKLAKSFRQAEPQKLTYGLLLVCFLVLLTYLSISKPYDALLSTIGLKLSSSESVQSGLMNSTAESKNGVLQRNSSSADVRFDNIAPAKEKDEVKNIQDFEVGNMNTMLNYTVAAIANAKSAPKGNESRGGELEVGVGRMNGTSNYTVEEISSAKSTLKGNESSGNELDGSKKEEEAIISPEKWKSMCDYSNRRSDVCDLTGDVRIPLNRPSVLLVAHSRSNGSHIIRPYARKSDPTAMSNVARITLNLSPIHSSPLCTHRHRSAALIFSLGGYAGNYFHDFSDILVPLFLTSRAFHGKVHFIVTEFNQWWINKYLPIFQSLSDHEILRFNGSDGGSVHCFPKAMIGLQSHNDMMLKDGESMVQFTEFLRRAYLLEREEPVRSKDLGVKKPRLMIIARRHTRRFVNLEKIVRMGEKEGFEVVAAEAEGNVARFARVVNTCDVLMGVHGAGLTNLVFLPTHAVVIQVVPWGKLGWISRTYFREPAMSMKLRYMEYEIEEEESTLMEVYGREDPVMREPERVQRLGWLKMKEIYLEKQNVRLNVRRFRGVLMEAMKYLRQR